jgi:hypothetical protein
LKCRFKISSDYAGYEIAINNRLGKRVRASKSHVFLKAKNDLSPTVIGKRSNMPGDVGARFVVALDIEPFLVFDLECFVRSVNKLLELCFGWKVSL